MRLQVFVTALLMAVTACARGPVGPLGPQGPPGVPPGSFSVLDYGAKPNDPSFDNTSSFQKAVQAAENAGGGTVRVPAGRFWFSGSLTIGPNVSLVGEGIGPYDPYTDPSASTVAPTLLPTSTSGPAFITLVGYGALQNLLIHYPNQVRPNAPNVETTGPIVYPATVLVLGTAKIFGCTFDNSYVAIQVKVGRTYLENLHLGGYKNDIVIDDAQDFVHISHVTASVFWDTSLGLPFPQPIDTWVTANSVALTSYRMDALDLVDFDVFWRNTGIAFLDSPQGSGVTWGVAANVDLDAVQYGVIAKSLSGAYGFLFTNLVVGAANGQGVDMIWLPPGGGVVPHVVVEGGAVYGVWTQPLKVEAGTLRVRDVVGLNPIGRLPALGIASPALPPSGFAYVSSMPSDAQVSISGGSVQDVLIGGQSTGLVSGMFAVAPGQSIAVVYANAPAWSWFLE